MPPRLHYLQHIEIETPAGILDWAADRNIVLSGTHLYRGSQLPHVENFDILVVMGGPMGAKDDHRYPWMAAEKKLIEAAIREGKKIIGICLGAQLLADVLGANVYPNAYREIGWFPINWLEQARALPAFCHLPKTQTVFHWHGDTFDLPAGALHLANSAACPNQAWMYNDRVLALQFHMEVKPEDVRLMAEHFSHELANEPWIQSQRKIVARADSCAVINESLFELLDRFLLTN